MDRKGQWALGRVHLGHLQPAEQLKGEGPVRVLFHGELDNADELRADLDAQGRRCGESAADLLRCLYGIHKQRAAGLLKGAFCAAILDETAGMLVLVADRLGSYPIYWFMTDDRFVFASELRAALRDHPRPSLNAAAVADFIKFGFPMGDKTLAQGVDMVPAGSTLTCCTRTGSVQVQQYASIADLFKPADVDHENYLDQVHAASEASMDRAVAGAHRFGLSLSGGLDTRVILSAMDRRGHSAGTATFTLGGRGCADEVIGYELAKMARTNHQFVALDDHYLDDLLPTVKEMVSLTDGMYLSHGFTEMLALQGFAGSDCAVLLRGHAGELAKASTAWPFHTDDRLRQMTTSGEFVPYMMSRLTHVSRGDAAREVFTDAWVESLDGASAATSLQQSVDGVPLRPVDLCSYVYLKEYHRRVTIPSLEIFRNVADVRLPLADIDMLAAVLRGPAAWRDGVAIHQALIRTSDARYLRVRNPNTGAPAGAGPLQEAILDKVNSLLRRLNVYGYRHYHSFDGWMRRSLLGLVDRVVLDPDTLARGVYRESTVRRMAAEAHAGKQDHDDLLQALVIVELWQREALQ
ncbi:MAG TPA: asparagine synthase-related protein [Vicinamibacterales bacterium]|nr:asparagine synthase-related protein [Vicinamibacterales bacterium]